jgi:LCP family protein required for cell wall assembly
MAAPGEPRANAVSRRQFKRKRKWRRIGVTVGLLLLLLATAVSVDLAWMVARIDRVAVPTTQSEAPGETWVIVGSDDRAIAWDGVSSYGFGGNAEYERADVIVVVQVPSDGGPARGISIPRDLVTPRADGTADRITLALEKGDSQLVGSLCVGLGIPTDHYVKVIFPGFIKTVDAMGGLTVDFPEPTRDARSHLSIDQAGSQVLDGKQALAFVRSRHPEYLVQGEWQAVELVEGDATRASNAAIALKALGREAGQALKNPLQLHQAAWAATSGITLDQGTALWEAPQVAQALGQEGATLTTLPFEPTGTELFLTPNEATYTALADMGYEPTGCSVATD